MEKSFDELISDTKKSLSQKNYDDALKNLNIIVKKDSNNLSALSSGLPILTMQGEGFQSRVTASLLKNLELDELIT